MTTRRAYIRRAADNGIVTTMIGFVAKLLRTPKFKQRKVDQKEI